MTTKILLDTDIGSDIDDAVCLAYLLAQPECDLLGVTTVTGDTDLRAGMASALCKVAGKDVPIYPGAKNPLLVPQQQPHVPQAVALERWPHETCFAHGQAVEFLRATIRAAPGEVTLLCIGPLTNIGLLFAVDPEIPALLRSLVLMAGYFFPDGEVAREYRARHGGAEPIEWNAKLDPHASAIVYRAAPPLHRSIGLDVSMRVRIPAAEVRRRFQVPLLRPVLDFAEVYFRDADEIIFHDPLAAVSIFDDAVCEFVPGTVQIDMQKELGRTIWTAGEAGSQHQVARTVNIERFFEDYFAVFK